MNDPSASMMRDSEAELVNASEHASPLSRRPHWRWQVTTVVGLTLVVSVLFIDRPIALWLDARFRVSSLAAEANEAFRRLDQLLPVAGGLGLLLGAWFTIHKSAPGWLRHVVSGSLAAALSLGSAVVLKFLPQPRA
jgi:hypothetical protein